MTGMSQRCQRECGLSVCLAPCEGLLAWSRALGRAGGSGEAHTALHVAALRHALPGDWGQHRPRPLYTSRELVAGPCCPDTGVPGPSVGQVLVAALKPPGPPPPLSRPRQPQRGKAGPVAATDRDEAGVRGRRDYNSHSAAGQGSPRRPP